MKQSEIAHLLPGIFQRTQRPGSPLYALLTVMETLHAPSEQVLAHLDSYFDPYRAPDNFVPFLAGWVDLEQLLIESPGERAMTAAAPLPSGMGRLRDLVSTAAYLSKWRGTGKGLLRFLETATGVKGFAIEEQVPDGNGQARPFHIRIWAPKETAPYRAMLEKIVEIEKPAYVTCDLEFAS
jgi:phage tail-like protein